MAKITPPNLGLAIYGVDFHHNYHTDCDLRAHRVCTKSSQYVHRRLDSLAGSRDDNFGKVRPPAGAAAPRSLMTSEGWYDV
jgi:hypothetical protein